MFLILKVHLFTQEAVFMHEAVDRTGFLSLHGNEDAWVEIYEGYLDEVIDLPVDHVKLETKVVSLWKQRGDADAFLERGN